MIEPCPVCATPWPSGLARCDRCGLPAALRGTVGTLEPTAVATEPRSPPPAPAETPPPPDDARTGEPALKLADRAVAIRAIGGEAGGFEPVLVAAALDGAGGEDDRAAERLSTALAAADQRLLDRARQKTAELQQRAASLRAKGLDLSPVWHLVAPTHVGEALEVALALPDAESRLAGWETEWAALAQLREETGELLALASELGLGEAKAAPPPDSPPAASVTAQTLDAAVVEARQRWSGLLEEFGPPTRHALEQLLERPDRLSPELSEPARLRAVRERIGHQIDHGQLLLALRTLASLTRSEPGAARRSAAGCGASAPAADSAPASPSESRITVEMLLSKARSFASRIRALPPDTVEARRAALEIRQATELLRAGRLDEADAALTRLMHTLPDVPGGADA
jgi:hypothetical protein